MRRTRGFTLLELLVAMVIIALLASMILFALFRAQQTASESKTKALIVKLHNRLARHWDTFHTRRVPIDTRDSSLTPRDVAELRLVGLRQLMRLEMPDRWSEVQDLDDEPMDGEFDLKPLKSFSGASYAPPRKLDAPPGLANVYFRYYLSVSVGIAKDDVPTPQYQNAECLYMIITRGLAQEDGDTAIFSEEEVGDVDGDGAKEFIDAWGSPIRFLRWPVGFVDDPHQDADGVPFGHLSDLQPAKMPLGAAAPYLACVPNAIDAHDPFDPGNIDKKVPTDPTNRESYAFRVFPLIYSAGPDRIFDIEVGNWDAIYDDPFGAPQVPIHDPPEPSIDNYRDEADPCGLYDPGADTPKCVGSPADLDSFLAGSKNGRLDHYDNIHNHLIETDTR